MNTKELEKLVAEAKQLPWSGIDISRDANTRLAVLAVNNILPITRDRDRLKQERDEVVKALRDLVGRIDFAAKEDDKSEEPETIRTFSMASAFMDHARTVLNKIEK